MDKTNLKSIIAVNEDLMFLADKLKEVAETLDAIVGSEEKIAREEAKKTVKKPTSITKTEKSSKTIKNNPSKIVIVAEKPKAKRGRPAKAK